MQKYFRFFAPERFGMRNLFRDAPEPISKADMDMEYIPQKSIKSLERVCLKLASAGAIISETFCFSVSETAFSVSEKCYFLKLFVFRSAKRRFRSAELFFTEEVCHIRQSIIDE